MSIFFLFLCILNRFSCEKIEKFLYSHRFENLENKIKIRHSLQKVFLRDFAPFEYVG